jgi:hypothetical protein
MALSSVWCGLVRQHVAARDITRLLGAVILQQTRLG